MHSDSEIEKAYIAGDADADDGLSLSEAHDALYKLSGKSIDESTIEAACSSCGVDIASREMNCDEFKEVVQYLESSGTL